MQHAREGMTRVKLTIAYVGTAYHGWQCQDRKDGLVLPTIQALLEKIVRRIVGAPVHVHGSGRTDAGVHAEAQIAHMDVPSARAGIDWQMAFNTQLPPDIRIVDARLATHGFHAQHAAVSKTYAYRLWLSWRYTPPFIAPFVWACGPVDVAAMDAASRYLVGTHDFSAVKNMGTPLESHVRTVLGITRSPSGPLGSDTLELVWRFQANGFLKQMVRNCMGLLVAAGRHKLDPVTIPDLLERKNRQAAPATAPSHGLTLLYVEY